MSQRLNYYKNSPELTKKVFELSEAVKKSSLGNTLLDLINIRPSQLNGCLLSRYAFKGSEDPWRT